LKTNGISRNHKLADSSIRAIVAGIFSEGIKNTFHVQTAQDALKRFFKSLVGDNAKVDQIATALGAVIDKRRSDKETKRIASDLEPIVTALSLGKNNVRFGDADKNELILHKFDPNIFGTSYTPRSDEIRASLGNLATVVPGLGTVIGAALEQLTSKPTGEKISSTLALEL